MTGKPEDDEGLSASARGMRDAQPYMDAMWRFVGGVLVGVLAGYFFDKKFGTGPWGLVTLLTLGTVGGFLGLIRSVSRLGKK